ncbi:MAG: response regulator [Robiginitomaculum sp.]|nr:response regulator [Robiginitomaculum sp.]
MKTEPHILVVDDQPDILEALCDHLGRNGFEVYGANSAQHARQLLSAKPIDLIILDIMMPGEDGLSLCRHVAEHSQIPVILLTALADETDKIVGLEIGADDYVTKPFNPRELVARIRSVLRRAQSGHKHFENRYMIFGDWQLDTQRAELCGTDNVIIPLSTGEYKLLKIFLKRRGETLSRDMLMKLTKGRDAHAFERSLDNMVSRLRRKIECDPSAPQFIKTVWGGGYSFMPESETLGRQP